MIRNKYRQINYVDLYKKIHLYKKFIHIKSKIII